MSAVMAKARAIIVGILLIVVGIGIWYIGQSIPNQILTTIIGIVLLIGGGIIVAISVKG